MNESQYKSKRSQTLKQDHDFVLVPSRGLAGLKRAVEAGERYFWSKRRLPVPNIDGFNKMSFGKGAK